MDARYALRWSFIAAFATSIYSLSDKLAVPSLPGFGAQLGFISVGYGMSLLLLTWLQYKGTGRYVPAQRPPWRYVLIGGLPGLRLTQSLSPHRYPSITLNT